MPELRSGVDRLPLYVAGKPIEEVARDFGLDPAAIVKLASNESPLPPFPEVIEAIAAELGGLNRYPDNTWHDLSQSVAAWLGVDPNNLMFAGGSSELLRVFALAVGGPGTSIVYPWPSFVIYRLASVLVGSEPVEVALDDRQRLDPEAMLEAIRKDTSLLFVCNPNNPTGSYLRSDEVKWLIDGVPERVLVVIDEAYLEYVTASDFATALPEALARPNVVVTRTFSKIFGLAGLRIGYAVGQAPTLTELRRAQSPFTVSSLAMAAAGEAVRHPQRIIERARINAEERSRLAEELEKRGMESVPSQTNFIFFRPSPGRNLEEGFNRAGVIVRAFGEDWLRVTIGTTGENDSFLAVLDSLTPDP